MNDLVLIMLAGNVLPICHVEGSGVQRSPSRSGQSTVGGIVGAEYI